MLSRYDLVVRGGTVADGLGSDLAVADVAVIGGQIAAVGRIEEAGAEEIDARGKLVTPGFVDIHTHYDGQVTWDSRLSPSSWHGVTTVVMGNCGVGFAPVRVGDQNTLIELMEGIEDIPGTALHDGLSWDWESFGDYLDALDGRAYDVDVCAQLPHGPLRLYVMRERATRLEDATPEDIARMRELAQEAIEAGALGFTTSRSFNHKSVTGDLTPTYRAREDELTGIALGLKAAGKGVLQWVSDWLEGEEEYRMIERIVRESGRPMSISVGQSSHNPEAWRQTLAMISTAREQGLDLTAQVASRPIGVILGLTASSHPFLGLETFAPLATKPLAEQLAAMKDAGFRARLVSEADQAGARYSYSRMFPIGDQPDYGQDPAQSIAGLAERSGRSPNELIYDLMLEEDGANLLFWAAVNYHDHSYDALREMQAHKDTVLGLSDGGAHVGMIADASFPTSALAIWGRPRPEGIGIPEVIRRQTSATAKTVGLLDRGIIAPGMKADLNVIDFKRLNLERPFLVYDLPAGAKRLLQRAQGYEVTIVSGVPTYRNGVATGGLPGKLVRGPQSRPANAPINDKIRLG